jgi:hypothetical protein
MPKSGTRLAKQVVDRHCMAQAFDVEGTDGIADRKRGSHRPLGVITERYGRAEHSHHAIADMLVDRAAEAFDQPVGQVEETNGELAYDLGAELMRQPGVTSEVAE